MEQYVHTLIAADPTFVPTSLQVEEFFETLTASCHFRIISDMPFQLGLRVIKPSGRFRTGTNSMTGETVSIPASDQMRITNISDVSRMIEGYVFRLRSSRAEDNPDRSRKQLILLRLPST